MKKGKGENYSGERNGVANLVGLENKYMEICYKPQTDGSYYLLS